MGDLISAKSWLGKRVEARTDSGWGENPGYTGIVNKCPGWQLDSGWFLLVPDNGQNPDGILAHTQEFFPSKV